MEPEQSDREITHPLDIPHALDLDRLGPYLIPIPPGHPGYGCRTSRKGGRCFIPDYVHLQCFLTEMERLVSLFEEDGNHARIIKALEKGDHHGPVL